MGINKRNGEGYADPTAYAAVYNIEAEEKILHIQYPTGYIDLNLYAFFPCTIRQARKIYRLIFQYCSDSDRMRLHRFLQKEKQHYASLKRYYWEQAKSATDRKKADRLFTQSAECSRLSDRFHRNLEMFEAREAKRK